MLWWACALATARALPRPSAPPGRGTAAALLRMARSRPSAPPAVHRAAYSAPLRCAVEECTDAPTRPAGCPGGRQPGVWTRGAGERSLSRQDGGAKKSRKSRTLAGVHGPRAATRRCQRGQPETRKVSQLRLVEPRHPRVRANLHCFGWNVLPVCGGATACGRRPRCFTSGGCEGTTLLKAFLSAFNTLCFHARSSVAVVAGAGLGDALPAGRGKINIQPTPNLGGG